APVSLKAYALQRGLDPRHLGRDERFARVTELAEHLMGAIARVIPAVPVSLAARAFVCDPNRAWSELELKAEILSEMRELESGGAHVYVPRGDQDYAIDVGLRMLTLRHLVVDSAGLFTPVVAELPILRYYANSIAHLFEDAEPDRRVGRIELKPTSGV
ncbi:MAG: hypothetical protein ABJC07_02585, partial [Acidobacteriota bacterium]